MLVYNIHGSLSVRYPRKINEDNLFVKQIHWLTREQVKFENGNYSIQLP